MSEPVSPSLPFLCNWCLVRLPNSGQVILTDCGSLFCSGECAYRLRQGALCTICRRYECRMLRTGVNGSELSSSCRRCLYADVSGLIDQLHQALRFREVQYQRLRERIQQCEASDQCRAPPSQPGRLGLNRLHPNASRGSGVSQTRIIDHAGRMDACVSQIGTPSDRYVDPLVVHGALAENDAPVDGISQSGTSIRATENRTRPAMSEVQTPRSPSRPTRAPTIESFAQSQYSRHTVRTCSERLQRIRRTGLQVTVGGVSKALDASTTMSLRLPGRSALGLPPRSARRGVSLLRHSPAAPMVAQRQSSFQVLQQRPREGHSSARSSPVMPISMRASHSRAKISMEVQRPVRPGTVTSAQAEDQTGTIPGTRPSPSSMNPLHWLANASMATSRAKRQRPSNGPACMPTSVSSTVSHTLAQSEAIDR